MECDGDGRSPVFIVGYARIVVLIVLPIIELQRIVLRVTGVPTAHCVVIEIDQGLGLYPLGRFF